MIYYYKDKRTNTTKAVDWDDLDEAFKTYLANQKAMSYYARKKQNEKANENYKLEMSAGVCPTCHMLRPLNRICPTCQ